MPTSARENYWDVREFVSSTPGIDTVFDVGAGEGTYWEFLHDLVRTIDAIEIHGPNIEEFGLREKYGTVWHADVRYFPFGDFDLVVFGDVLEHMTVDDAVRVFATALTHSRFVLVSVPIVHYPQDPAGVGHGDNEHERHLIEDAQEDLLPRLAEVSAPIESWDYRITGTRVYRGSLA